MAANESKIDVTIKSSIQTITSATEKLRKSGQIKPKDTQDIRLANLQQSVQGSLAKGVGNLSSSELKALNSNLSEMFTILRKAASTMPNISKSIVDALEAVNRAEAKRNRGLDQVASAKEQQRVANANFTEANSGVKYRSRDADGKLKYATTPTAIRKLIESGIDYETSVATNDKGKNIWEKQNGLPTGLTRSQDIASTLEAVKNQEAAVAKANAELKIFTQELDAANFKLSNLNKTQPQDTGGNPESGQIINDIGAASNDVKTQLGQQIGVRQAAESQKAEETNATSYVKGLTALAEETGAAFKKAAKYLFSYQVIVRSIKSAVKEAIKTITELDKSLTEQAMVTGKTRKETYQLLGSYQSLAIQLGATTKEVAEIATQYMRQGKTTQEAITLTEAAISSAKVAGISATDSINYLTTALNGFQMSASEAMKVSDKFAAVAANSATSYDEIATALSKVASQANLAGMSIDYTTALLAKGLETTREAPETMGTALKTVIARMRELGDYGETLGGDTDINNVESQLAYIGIALRDANGELRSTEDVLDELGKKWDTLNGNQQAAVAKALAGTRLNVTLAVYRDSLKTQLNPLNCGNLLKFQQQNIGSNTLCGNQ